MSTADYDKSFRLNDAEKQLLLDAWAASGRSLNECERVTGINPFRVRRAAS